MDARAHHSPAVENELLDRAVVDDDRAGFHSADCVGECESRVVGRRIEVGCAAEQPVRLEHRFGVEHARAAESPVTSHVSEQGERIVQREPRAQLPLRDSRARIHRPCEGEWSDEMWSKAQQPSTFGARLEHKVQVSVLEVSDAAVHQTRRTARRSARKIILLDERDRESAECGIARDSASRDSAADDQQVEGAVGKRSERRMSSHRVGLH